MSKSNVRAGIIAGVGVFMMTLGAVFYTVMATDEPPSMVSPAPDYAVAVSDQAGTVSNLPVVVEELGAKPGELPSTNRPRFVTPAGQNAAPNFEAVPSQQPSQRPSIPPDRGTAGNVEQAGSAEAAERRRVQIQDAFRSQMTDFRECYDLVLELEPTLGDRLVLELLVRTGDPKPTTELISIESGRMEVEHISCFAEAAAEMQMPPPDGADQYAVRYPIVLSVE